MDETYDIIFSLIRAIFHGDTFFSEKSTDWNTVLTKMDVQKVATLASDFCSILQIEELTTSKWKNYFIWNRIYFEKILAEQAVVFKMLQDVPSAVLKGSAAAIYYPDSHLRTMGDIDILVDFGHYENAWNILNEKYEHKKHNEIKHAKFLNGNVEIELHKGMASHYLGEKQKYFDHILFDAMDRLEKRIIDGHEFWMFPKTENGLILVRHMHQHMLEGIGLRHVVDWMAYLEDREPVDWARFKEVAQEIGIYKFLCVLTKMCEIYLDARVDSSARELLELDAVSERLCERLMEYVISRGNFGMAMDTYAGKLAMKDVQGNVIKRLQLGGMCRWKAAQEHKVLRPFAWIYQGVRLSKELLGREDAMKALKADMVEAEKVKALMNDLELECNKAWVKWD